MIVEKMFKDLGTYSHHFHAMHIKTKIILSVCKYHKKTKKQKIRTSEINYYKFSM